MEVHGVTHKGGYMKCPKHWYVILLLSCVFSHAQSVDPSQQSPTTKLFDALYPLTPSTYITQHLMQVWDDLRYLVSLGYEADDYAYYDIIGHVRHIADVVDELIATNHPYIIAEDTLNYYLYILDHMIDDAYGLKVQGRTLLYKRLIKELGDLLYLIEIY